MEGLKEAIEFITNLKEGSMEPKVLDINGNTYCNKNLTKRESCSKFAVSVIVFGK